MKKHVGTAIMAALAMAMAAGSAPAGEPVLVELFTSQGCNSCPPADEYLDTIADRADVLALSFHVDYWNYLGWRDPFSSRAYTDRQRAYRESLRLRHVYTPQIVVDGAAEAVGSDRAAIEALIAQRRAGAKLAVTIAPDGLGGLLARLPAGEGSGEVWLVEFDRAHKTAVARGENAGRSLVNANVVRSWRKLGEWNGAASEFKLGSPPQAKAGGCAVIVQRKGTGSVLGAAALRWSGPS
jgi:hypothetical protein